jgi:DNA-binding CsgD family transcriptional regulator
MLEALGIDTTAAVIYQVLISGPASTVASLAETAGIAEAEVSTALEQLSALGLVHNGIPSPRPADPQLALTALLRRREAEVARHQQDLAAARAAVATAAAAWSASRGCGGCNTSMATSVADAVSIARQLIAAATDQCLIAVPDPGLVLRSNGRAAAVLTAEGTRVAVLCADATRSDSRTIAAFHYLGEVGAEVRTIPTIAMPLITAGSHASLLWPGPPDDAAMPVLIQDATVIATLTAIFFSQWEIAIPFQEPLPHDPATGLTRADVALLTLIGAGLTDDAAARRLGTSVRTVARQMSRLMDMLHATSRFQAGHLAARRGWL